MRLLAVCVGVLFAISVHVVPSMELCHFVIVPVFPFKVNVVLLVPEHTVDPPDKLPPTLALSTFIVPVAFTLPQPTVKGIL